MYQYLLVQTTKFKCQCVVEQLCMHVHAYDALPPALVLAKNQTENSDRTLTYHPLWLFSIMFSGELYENRKKL